MGVCHGVNVNVRILDGGTDSGTSGRDASAVLDRHLVHGRSAPRFCACSVFGQVCLPQSENVEKNKESVVERRSGMGGVKKALNALPVNDPSFLEKTDIDEQDEFYHKFFVERARRDEMKGTVRGKNTKADDEYKAFDLAENINLEHKVSHRGQSFGHGVIINVVPLVSQFGQDWDTDEEEEKFVDFLAMKLIEDAAEADVDDLDDEDPAMEGWDEIHSDFDDANEENDAESADSSDVVAFMDKMDEMSDVDDWDEEAP